jgi:hypothetical protein
MAGDGFNMSLRKFLKRVGVTSQQQIEDAVRAAQPAGDSVKATMRLTIPALGLDHVIEGEIDLGDDA